jgi:hypothetical protein
LSSLWGIQLLEVRDFEKSCGFDFDPASCCGDFYFRSMQSAFYASRVGVAWKQPAQGAGSFTGPVEFSPFVPRAVGSARYFGVPGQYAQCDPHPEQMNRIP